MISYALRRAAWTVPILFLTLTLVFFVLRGIGGDPLRRGQLAGLSNVEVLRQEYVRTAVAKGLRRTRVVGVHVLRNSLTPAASALGPMLGYLVTGSFVVEYVFGIPGIARYFVAGTLARDYPLVLGLTALLTVVMVLANLAPISRAPP